MKCKALKSCFHLPVIHQAIGAVDQTDYFLRAAIIYFDINLFIHLKMVNHETSVVKKARA